MRRVLISGPESLAALRRFLASRELGVARAISRLWRTQAALITPEVARGMAESGQADSELFRKVERLNEETIHGKLQPASSAGMTSAWDDLERRIRRVSRKDAILTRPLIQSFVNSRGGQLITRLNSDIRGVIANLLKLHTIRAPLTPFQISKLLRPQLGLTQRFSDAVLKRYLSDLAGGMSPAKALEAAEKYSTFLHKVRAMNIARTELAEAYGEGQLQAVREAQESGELAETVRKNWATADDERTCGICLELDGEERLVDEAFSNGQQRNPAHNSCRCSIQYLVG